MASSPYNTNEFYAKELEDELMKYTRRDEQNKTYVRMVEKFEEEMKNDEVKTCKETEVNIIECTKSVRFESVDLEYQDATESSSSFEYSKPGEENDAFLADSEVLSEFHGDEENSQNFDRLHELFRMRKKKLTDHWRSYIQPLIWRCKWVELQIKKLESQSQVFQTELEVCKKEKKTLFEDSELKNGVKSVSFSPVNSNNDVFRRKKRRRGEDTTNISEYVLQHKLFSYYENKKIPTDSASKRTEIRNPVKLSGTVDVDAEFSEENGLLFGNHEDANYSTERLLWKILSLQSQVGKLKSKMGRLVSQNGEILASLDDFSFSMPSSASTQYTDGKEHTIEFAMQEYSLSSHGDTVDDDMDCMGSAPSVSARKGVGDAILDHAEAKEEDHNSKSNDLPVITPPKEPEKAASNQHSRRVHSFSRLAAPSSSRRKRGRRRRGVGLRSRKSSA